MKIVNSREEYLVEALNVIGTNGLAVELGVMYGDFSRTILDVLKPAKLILVDPFELSEQRYLDTGDGEQITTAYSTESEYRLVSKRFENEIKELRVLLNRNYSYNVLRIYPDNLFDFIYIDACHLYECVKQDLNDWLPKLKEGGLMCGHDYFEGFSGVIEAVDEFCAEHDFEMILLNNNGFDWALKCRH